MAGTTLELGDGQTAVVGFGLLLVPQTLEKTLGRAYDGPFVRGHVEGWRRSWDVSMPNAAFYYEEEAERVYPERIVYLNVRREPGCMMSCTVFVLGPDELETVNGREWIYEGVDVAHQLRGIAVSGGPALMNVGRPEHTISTASSPREAALRRSYLEMIDGVLAAAGPDVRDDYLRTTDPVPEKLVIDDVLDPDRPNPWEAAGHDFDPSTQQGID